MQEIEIKRVFQKDQEKNRWTGREGRGEETEKQQCEHQGQQREEEALPGRAGITAVHGGPKLEQVDVQGGHVACGEPPLE